MPKKHRLTHAELEELQGASGKRLQGRLFSLRAIPFPGTSPRIAIVVSKKANAKAVVRNKIRRRCRSVIASLLPSIPAGFALIVAARREAAGASFEEVRTDLTALVGKLR